MSKDFLAGYHIPTVQSHLPGTNPPPPEYALEEQQVEQALNFNSYQNYNRYVPPGLQGTNFVPPLPSKIKKRKYEAGPGKQPQPETTVDGQMVIFHGRDISYPDELNALIHPLNCSLCGVKMNSPKSAKDHYESKQHDRSINHWLGKNYSEKGLEAPAVKRFIKQGPVGPDVFHCDACDLSFSSLAHASQHYAGRKHRLVVANISQPSGSGYYDANQKWVRTGTKYEPKADSDRRFGIGELFKSPHDEVTAATQDEATPDTTTEPASIETKTSIANKNALASLHCEICNIRVTSVMQMEMHLDGIKHQKKLKALYLEATILPNTVYTVQPGDTILQSLNKSNPSSDFSMYRTPSGSYYCEICNMNLGQISALQQHLIGKKHLKKVCEKKEKDKAEAKNKAIN